jgi:predicted acyl esterase
MCTVGETEALCIPMRDGTELAGVLYRPARPGPLPTLLRKTPYPAERNQDLDLGLVSCGFAVAVVHQRGRFGSGGRFYQYRNESVDHSDGYDTIEWLAAQPWGNGRIGTFGTSSDGQWQLAAAVTAPPSLAAMFVSYAADPRLARVDRGAYVGTGPAWASLMDGLARRLGSVEDWADWLADWRSSGLPLLASFLAPEVIDAFTHLDYDEWWEELDPSSQYSRVAVPALHECGWFDRYVRTTIRNFSAIRRDGATPAARRNQHLVLGPWVHGGGLPDAPGGPVTVGSHAVVDRLEMHRRWFARWLDDVEGQTEIPPVQIYITSADRWLSGQRWPPEQAGMTWYLAAGGSTGQSLNDGALVPRVPSERGADRFDHDPFDPVPSIGGHGGVGWQWPAGPLDQRPAERRSLTYTSGPLPEDLVVVGEPVVRFHASSTAVDTDWVATLSEVDDDGYSAILRQNALRAAYRDGERRWRALIPGQPHEYRLALDAIAHRFAAGNRVRLRLCSSSFPAYLPNHGTDAPLALSTSAVNAENVVLYGGAYTSSVELPVLSEVGA